MFTYLVLVIFWYLISFWKACTEKDYDNFFYRLCAIIDAVVFISTFIIIMVKYLP